MKPIYCVKSIMYGLYLVDFKIQIEVVRTVGSGSGVRGLLLWPWPHLFDKFRIPLTAGTTDRLTDRCALLKV